MGYIWGKTNFEKTYPKEFFDAFMMIWVWKSGFNSWNQNFRKCTLFAGSTIHRLRFLIGGAHAAKFTLDCVVKPQVMVSTVCIPRLAPFTPPSNLEAGVLTLFAGSQPTHVQHEQ